MRALFVANVHLEKNEGIYKKIVAEAKALGTSLGECELVIGIPNKKGSLIYNTKNDSDNSRDTDVMTTAITLIKEQTIDLLYIRLMIPTFKLVELMKYAQKKGIDVFYEIPTYPYYAEQFRTSRRKYRAIVKLVLDKAFSPFVYKYCTWMPLVKSNSNIPLKKKMIEITNGVMIDGLKGKSYLGEKGEVFRMVTVGTLYPYHGYDRILYGLKECKEEINGMPVEFHIVGESQTINDLKLLSQKLELKRVVFHGIKTTEELNQMYEQFDVGLGCLALHRRNADIDTTLKIIEYYCRGVPVVTSGISPMDNYMPVATIRIDDGEDPISIKNIYNQYISINQNDMKRISNVAKEKFSWDWIFGDLMRKTINLRNNK